MRLRPTHFAAACESASNLNLASSPCPTPTTCRFSVAAGSWEDLQIEGYVPGVSENMKIYRSVVAAEYLTR